VEKIFCDKEVEYAGQGVGLIIAGKGRFGFWLEWNTTYTGPPSLRQLFQAVQSDTNHVRQLIVEYYLY
jgi:hypothetical protein